MHLRVLRSESNETYIIVIKMDNLDNTIRFVNEFHKKRFNHIEPEICEISILESAHFVNLKSDDPE